MPVILRCKFLIGLSILVAWCTSSSYGQELMLGLANPPSLEQVASKADAIVIGSLSGRTRSTLRLKREAGILTDVSNAMVLVRSEFQVLASLKGTARDKIGVLHYIFQDSPDATDSRVGLVHFQSGEHTLSLEDANVQCDVRYLMFLKKFSNGDFGPATGQMEAKQSFLHVVPTVPQFGQSVQPIAVEGER